MLVSVLASHLRNKEWKAAAAAAVRRGLATRKAIRTAAVHAGKVHGMTSNPHHLQQHSQQQACLGGRTSQPACCGSSEHEAEQGTQESSGTHRNSFSMCSRRTPQSSTYLLGLTGRLPAERGHVVQERQQQAGGRAGGGGGWGRPRRPPLGAAGPMRSTSLAHGPQGSKGPGAPCSPAARCCWCCRDAARPLSCRPTAWAACRSDMAAGCSLLAPRRARSSAGRGGAGG